MAETIETMVNTLKAYGYQYTGWEKNQKGEEYYVISLLSCEFRGKDYLEAVNLAYRHWQKEQENKAIRQLVNLLAVLDTDTHYGYNEAMEWRNEARKLLGLTPDY